MRPLVASGSVQTAPIISPSCAWTEQTPGSDTTTTVSGSLGASGTGWATNAALARATSASVGFGPRSMVLTGASAWRISSAV